MQSCQSESLTHGLRCYRRVDNVRIEFSSWTPEAPSHPTPMLELGPGIIKELVLYVFCILTLLSDM